MLSKSESEKSTTVEERFCLGNSKSGTSYFSSSSSVSRETLRLWLAPVEAS